MGGTVRTKEELLRPEYNYYLAFGINPNEQDTSKIKNTILQKKNDWMSKGAIEGRYIELFSDIKQVMFQDARSRALELANAKKIKLGEAEHLITSMAGSRKRFYKSELMQAVRGKGGEGNYQWFTLEELEHAVQYLTEHNRDIRYIDDTKTILDFSTYKKIEENLVVVNKKTLYAVIGGESDNSVEALTKCGIDTSSSNNQKKKSPEKTAVGRLCSFAGIVFKTEESKQKYDMYLETKEEVWDGLKRHEQHGMKEMELTEYLWYAEKLKTVLGMELDEAEQLLATGLKHFHIACPSIGEIKDENGNLSQFEYCPYPECGKLYKVYKDKEIKSCPHCGQPLELLCWNCGGTIPYTSKKKDKICFVCGSAYSSKALFDRRLKDLQSIVGLPSCDAAQLRSALHELKNTVPNYQKNKTGKVYTDIEKYEKLVDTKIKEEETTGANYKRDVEKIQKQIALKNYQQASSWASDLRKNYGAYNVDFTSRLIDDIKKKLDLAKVQVQQAKTYMAQNNENQVIACAAKALELCADDSEARQILQKYPPQVPANFRVTVTGSNAIRLEWSKSGNQASVTYTILKKVGSKPTGITDGDVIGSNLTIDFYEDTNIVSATPYYYAVYAVRSGITSAIATSSSASQLFFDVSDIRQEVVPDNISVKWSVPCNAKSVEVWKKEGLTAPSKAGDGTRVAVKTLDGFTDSIHGSECGYLILCQYEVNGVKQYSRGVRRVFKKYEQLQQIEEVTIVPQQTGEFLLTCKPPQSGKLSVVYSKGRLLCNVDTVLQMVDFNQLCKNAAIADISCDATQNMKFTLPQNQILWAYPMLSNEQLFILSPPILVSTINGIKNVSFTEANGTVFIQGILDAGIKNVVAKVGEQRFPLGIHDEGDTFSVSKERFMSENGMAVKLKEDTLSYISVFTEIEQNGKMAYTKAVPINDEPIQTLRKRIVQYAIEYTISANKSFPVTLKFSADEEVELPRLCLVKGFPCPMDKSSGELVEKIEPITLKKSLFSKKYTAKQTITAYPDSPKMRFAVFIDDAQRDVRLKQVKSI